MNPFLNWLANPNDIYPKLLLAILVSLTTRFIYDVLSRQLAKVSVVVRNARQQWIEIRDRRISNMVAHPNLLILEAVGVVMDILYFFGIMSMFFFFWILSNKLGVQAVALGIDVSQPLAFSQQAYRLLRRQAFIFFWSGYSRLSGISK